MDKIISWAAAAASFSMIFWQGAVKPADAIFLGIGILLLFSEDARRFFKEVWPKLRPYVLYLFLILLFIAFAQGISQIRGINVTDGGAVKNYARIILNSYVFLLVASLVAYRKENLRFISAALLASPMVITPALWNLENRLFLSGGRLTGLMQSPIIFGMWMMVIYLAGLGIFLNAKNKAVKAALFAWLSVIASFILWAASRASWLGLAAAAGFWILYYLFRQKNATRAAYAATAFIFTFILGYLLLPASKTLDVKSFTTKRIEDTVSAAFEGKSPPGQAHFRVWPIVLNELVYNPAGLGFGGYLTNYLGKIKESQDPGIPHSANNTFLEVAVYGGLGALVTFVLLVLRLGAEIKNALFAPATIISNHLKFAWLTVAPAVLIDIFFTDGFLLRHVWLALGAALGAALPLNRRQSTEKAPKETL